MPDTRAETAAALRCLEVGQSFTFVMGSAGELGIGGPRERRAFLRARVGDPAHVGLGWVTARGELVFAGPSLDEEAHRQLSRLARDTEHGGLRALVGCVLLRVRADGAVSERFEDPDLWEGLRPAGIPGSLHGTERVLARMTPELPCGFWMSEEVPGGRPHVIVHPQPHDPDGQRLATWAARLRSPGATQVWGIARLTAGRALMLSITGDLGEAEGVLRGLLEELLPDHPGLAPLASARWVQLRGQKVTGFLPSGSP